MATKIRTSFSLAQEVLDKIEVLAKKHRRSKASMLEIMVLAYPDVSPSPQSEGTAK